MCPRQGEGARSWNCGPQLACGGRNLTIDQSRMSVLDLAKVTVIFGLLSFLIYSWPPLGQGMVIGVLGLLWLCYAWKAALTLRRRWVT